MSSTLNKRLAVILCLLLVTTLISATVWANYIPSARDTKESPEAIVYTPADLSGLQKLTDIGSLSFYFRDERDVMVVVDNRNGYTWKTGLDLPYNDELGETDPREDKMNAIYNELYNSLITVEYYDSSDNIKSVSSTSRNDARSVMNGVDGDPTHWRLDIDFTAINLQLSVHMYLSETGIRFEVKDSDINGAGQNRLAAILIAPYLGASGGQKVLYNEETKQHDIRVRNPEMSGYVFVPDGSGALIRFSSHTANLRQYIGNVYGGDVASDMYYQTIEGEAVPIKEPLMPVFGIAHGDQQAAFVSYASSGEENLEIVVSPQSSQTFYTNAYARFTYVSRYYYVYNRKGEGYFRLATERPHYDAVMHYEFLAGDSQSDGYAADYTGMAAKYRDYLLNSGELSLMADSGSHIPLHVDMVMSEIKKGVIGNSDVVTTTAKQALEIVNDILSNGIASLNVGLMGAQSGGITGGKPWALNFGKTGSSSDYKKLIASNADVSFRQDYLKINSTQMSLPSNSTRHINGQLVKKTLNVEPSSVPVSEIQYARPDNSIDWLKKQSNAASKLGAGSISIDGISRMAVSDFGKETITSYDTIAMLRETLNGLNMKVNASSPNQYMWKYTNRFLDTPMFSSSYILETDTVPFLQMVLHGTMEMYGPYANLSFYNRSDVLRMIDYNTYPSFILTYEPSHQLATTNSSGYYSTEYSLYAETIRTMYADVDATLGAVHGREWLSREVLQPGVIVNTYSGSAQIYINYTDYPVDVNGISVPAEGFAVKGV